MQIFLTMPLQFPYNSFYIFTHKIVSFIPSNKYGSRNVHYRAYSSFKVLHL